MISMWMITIPQK